MKIDDFLKIYADTKKSKDMGSFEDFIECLKLYDKQENGTMMMGELEHILLSLGKQIRDGSWECFCRDVDKVLTRRKPSIVP